MTCQLGPGFPGLPLPITVVPFISQITTAPLSFCHWMSARPSALKSPVPLACQFGPGLLRLTLPMSLVPLSSQMATSPLSFCYRKSNKPSPLKSPMPLTCQLGPGLPRLAPPVIAVPFDARGRPRRCRFAGECWCRRSATADRRWSGDKSCHRLRFASSARDCRRCRRGITGAGAPPVTVYSIRQPLFFPLMRIFSEFIPRAGRNARRQKKLRLRRPPRTSRSVAGGRSAARPASRRCTG
jgi:hypothetical protein